MGLPLPTPADIAEFFRELPVGRELAEHLKAKNETRRKALKAERAEAKKLEQGLPQATKLEAEAAEALRTAEAEFVKVKDTSRAATHAVLELRGKIDHIRATTGRQLREIAPLALVEEKQRLLDLHDAMRLLPVRRESTGRTWDGFAAGVTSNAPSISAYVRYLLEAIRTVDALMEEGLTDAEAEAQVAKLRASMPDPLVMVALP